MRNVLHAHNPPPLGTLTKFNIFFFFLNYQVLTFVAVTSFCLTKFFYYGNH